MTSKRFTVVKCIENQWGIIDYSLEDVDQLILIHTNKTEVSIIVNELNRLNEENEHIKQTIKDMINTERTELGKMTLRQLWRQIQ